MRLIVMNLTVTGLVWHDIQLSAWIIRYEISWSRIFFMHFIRIKEHNLIQNSRFMNIWRNLLYLVKFTIWVICLISYWYSFYFFKSVLGWFDMSAVQLYYYYYFFLFYKSINPFWWYRRRLFFLWKKFLIDSCVCGNTLVWTRLYTVYHFIW